MSNPRIGAMRHFAFALTSVMMTAAAFGQGIPEERNVNVIGLNPPVAPQAENLGVPDTGLKQQNEPACAMKPSNPLQIICAFNDYRGVDDPAIGDAWEGYAYSINGGQTWFSDLLPGHPGDAQNVGLEFAADPQVAAAPGIALISYIAADRGDNAPGGLFLQRMFEVNREAGAPWVPEMMPNLVLSGNAGIFIDKPFMLLHPAAAGSGTIMVSGTLKDGSPIDQEVPAATIFLAHTSFVGNDVNVKTKMLLSISHDYGVSWSTTKLSESQAINQSASIAAYDNNACAVWRRFDNGRQSDAILAACSTDRGGSWSKAVEVSADLDFSPFDQGTTENSFRVNSYPVVTHDGSQFYAFWANRKNVSPFFARIVYSTSIDGTSWSPPAMIDDAAIGHQYMPSVATARGTIQLAWMDTRDNLFQSFFVEDVPGVPPNQDDDSLKIIRNKGDVRTTQFIGGMLAANSVRVSRYLEGALEEDGPVQQLEFNFLNDRIFQQGSVPFTGDYPNVAAPTFRLEGGEWVSNTGPSATLRPVDFLVTWTDNRNVRGNVWENLSDPTVYTPANMTAGMMVSEGEKRAAGDAGEQLAAVEKDGSGNDISPDGERAGLAVNLADSNSSEARADAEPDPTDNYMSCVDDGLHRDRTRNQDVYSSVVRPGVSVDSPSSSKPTGIVQRAHVAWVSNNTDVAATYTLTIDNQPLDAPMNGRASFLQVPVAPFTDDTGLLTEIPVDIDPNSTVARTVFVSSQETNPPINVSVKNGDGTVVFGTITINPDFLAPDIQNPDVQNPDVQNPDIQNAEVHNPDVQNVVITTVANPDVQNPDVQNPDVQNPDVQNPDVQNPDIQNPDIQNPDIQNTSLDGSSTENPDTEYDGELTEEDRAAYTDITSETTNNGNTTTAFNIDAFVNADTTGLKTQLIATRTQYTQTSRDCVQGTQVQNEVIFNESDPDLSLFDGNSNDGVFGDGAAYVAPGETIFVTLRVWGDPVLLEFDPETVGIQVEAQSCNSEDKDLGTVDCDPPSEQTIPSAADITFDFIEPVIGEGGGGDDIFIEDINSELEQFGVEWEEEDGVLRVTNDAFGFTGIFPPSLAFNSFEGEEEFIEGTHTARFVCPDGSGRLATVSSASINVADTEVDEEADSVGAISYDRNGLFLESVPLAGSVTDTLEFTVGPIASITFTDIGGDGHLLDNFSYEGRECVPEFTETVITGDVDILAGGAFVMANDLGASPSGVTIGNVNFGIDQSGLSVGWGNGGGDFSVDAFSSDLDDVLSDLVFSGTLTPVTLTLGGGGQTPLIAGRVYRLQLLFSNDLNLTGNNIAVTVEGKTHVLDDWQDDAINLITEFTATGPTVVITFEPGPGFVAGDFPADEPGRAVLNGYALHDLSPPIIQ